jgi:multicomponent Na+:H+ antiporter subunit D
MGALMVVTGGLWSMFQNHLARIFGYAVIIETGFSLLAAGLGRQEQFSSFALLFMPRLAATAVWVLCLAIIEKKTGTLRMQDLRSLGKGAPFLAGGLLVAQLSLAGLPVLASFPAKYNILARIAAESPATAAWLLIGIFGSLLAALRTAYIFFLPVDLETVTPSTRWQRVLILAGVGVLFMTGLFPQMVLIPFRDILQAFQTLLGT